MVIQFNLVPHIKGRTQTEFKNGVLRNIFELKRKVVRGGCKKLRHDDIHGFYSSTNAIREVNQDELYGVDGVCGTHVGEDKSQYGLVGKHEGTTWKT